MAWRTAKREPDRAKPQKEVSEGGVVLMGTTLPRFTRLPSQTLQPKMLLQEAMRFQNIGDGQVQMVELHVRPPGGAGGSPLLIRFAIRTNGRSRLHG